MIRRPIWWLAAAALLFGSVTRFYGHGRDLSHFVLPERVAEYGIATDFYEFHPDEETLVRAALQLETPLIFLFGKTFCTLILGMQLLGYVTVKPLNYRIT